MLKINQCLTTRSEINGLKALTNNNIIYSTRLHGVKIIESFQGEKKVHISNQEFSFKTTALAFSVDERLIAFANKNIIYILDIPTHKVIKTIKTQEIIQRLVFDESSTYIISGSSSGRVTQYKYNSSSSLARLCSFPVQRKENVLPIKKNFVSAFATYKNFLACSGYGGDIFIIDLHSRVNKSILLENHSQIDALCFVNKTTVISANKDGLIFISSFDEEVSSQIIQTDLLNISQIILMQNPHYIMVNTNTDSLAIIDIKSCTVIEKSYLKFEDKIGKIALTKNGKLFVSLDNLTLLDIQLPTIEDLENFVNHNELSKAFYLIENSPMLKDSKECRRAEKKYHHLYLKAVDALTHNNKDLAKTILAMFDDNHYKKDEIALLFSSFEHFAKFKVIVIEKKYAIAYAMCAKYPAFTHTIQYKKMEQAWKETFANAQRQMLIGRDDLAKAILKEHMTTASKKTLINFILNDTHKFLKFLKAVDKKDFKVIHILINENEIFTQIPNFVVLNKDIESNILKIEQYIKEADVSSADRLLVELSKIPYIKDRLIKLNSKNRDIKLLQKAYKNDNLKYCYEILDRNKTLTSTDLGELLENNWSSIIKTCEEYALKGDVKGIKTTLHNLIQLKTRTDKIGDLLRVSYHIKIKSLINEKKFNTGEKIILSYLSIFGIDNELQSIQRLFEKFSSRKIVFDEEIKKLPRDNWLSSEFIMNMVDKT